MTIIGTQGLNVPIPKMFDKNERDRLIWREGVLKGRGYRIKMSCDKRKPIYVKTRGDMEKVIRDHPKLLFKLTELK
jgi:hypothetical protein